MRFRSKQKITPTGRHRDILLAIVLIAIAFASLYAGA